MAGWIDWLPNVKVLQKAAIIDSNGKILYCAATTQAQKDGPVNGICAAGVCRRAILQLT